MFIPRPTKEENKRFDMAERTFSFPKDYINEFMNTIVQEDFELICFDIVSEPSTPNAYIYPEKKIAVGSRVYENKINEKSNMIIDNLFNKILRD